MKKIHALHTIGGINLFINDHGHQQLYTGPNTSAQYVKVLKNGNQRPCWSNGTLISHNDNQHMREVMA